MHNRVMIVHDDAAVAAEMGARLREDGYHPLLLDDARAVRAVAHQERPSVIMLVQQDPSSTIIWDALQILWLDRAISHTPIVLCLNELENLRCLTARLRRNRALVLPLPTPPKMLLAALAAVARTPTILRPTSVRPAPEPTTTRQGPRPDPYCNDGNTDCQQ